MVLSGGESGVILRSLYLVRVLLSQVSMVGPPGGQDRIEHLKFRRGKRLEECRHHRGVNWGSLQMQTAWSAVDFLHGRADVVGAGAIRDVHLAAALAADHESSQQGCAAAWAPARSPRKGTGIVAPVVPGWP